MRFQRIVNLHFGSGAVAREGMIVARRVAQRDVEIVDAIQLPGDCRAEAGVTVTVIALLLRGGTPRLVRVRPVRRAGCSQRACKRKRIIPAADALQIARRRVAGVALAGGLK